MQDERIQVGEDGLVAFSMAVGGLGTLQKWVVSRSRPVMLQVATRVAFLGVDVLWLLVGATAWAVTGVFRWVGSRGTSESRQLATWGDSGGSVHFTCVGNPIHK